METSFLESTRPEQLTHRHLSIAGSPNFRDAGGYQTTAGPLRWRRLFRSGHLADLSEGERAKL
ncbi:MAG: tyrosine-protein phosphatase, partial [Pseudomonadota bacterium]